MINIFFGFRSRRGEFLMNENGIFKQKIGQIRSTRVQQQSIREEVMKMAKSKHDFCDYYHKEQSTPLFVQSDIFYEFPFYLLAESILFTVCFMFTVFTCLRWA